MFLVLENGMVFEGQNFGAQGEVTGEVVFTTGMTGYLETLTDPSYHGQIVLQTFPLIGNYGIIPEDFESANVGLSAYITKHPCQVPSNFRSEGSLDIFLRERGITGLCGIDTRAVTKIIREHGVLNGKIVNHKPTEDDLYEIQTHKIKNPVQNVTCREKKFFAREGEYTTATHDFGAEKNHPCGNPPPLGGEGEYTTATHDFGAKKNHPCGNPSPLRGESGYTVAMYDFGAKENICRELQKRGCDVWVFPAETSADEILKISPHGIMLSNGPGDPTDNAEIVENVRVLMQKSVPMFGICLGHQLMALANGCETRKLKYGHRGANQPVKDTQTGKVYITSQNHGYEVVSSSISKNVADEWFFNVNDRSCEGILYKNTPAFSVQFHPEACGGPKDTSFIFDKFVEIL